MQYFEVLLFHARYQHTWVLNESYHGTMKMLRQTLKLLTFVNFFHKYMHYLINLWKSLEQSPSNLTHKLFMMKGWGLLILGLRFKGQGQLWHSICENLSAWFRLHLPNYYTNFKPRWYKNKMCLWNTMPWGQQSKKKSIFSIKVKFKVIDLNDIAIGIISRACMSNISLSLTVQKS